MRILLWYWGRRGGGAQHALCLARALAKRPDVALALSVSAQGELAEGFASVGVPCEQVSTFRGPAGFIASTFRLPAIIGAFRRQVRDFRADVVISVMSHVWTPIVAPSIAGTGAVFVPIIHDALPHPGDPALLWHWRLRRELRAAGAAVVLSDAVGRVVAAEVPDLPLIRGFLGAHVTQPAAPAERTADVVFFGRMRAYKGLDLLRDAWPLVLRRHPDARLRLVGEGDPDSLAPGLTTLPGVTADARWVPEAEMPGLIASAGIVVLPYREASQSGVLPLAIAAGVPVVATRVGGLSEQMIDGEGGILADVDAASLADAISRLMDPDARKDIIAAGQAAAARLADWDAQAADLVAGLRAIGIGRG
ncbi:glycosyltransferase family 4 protein [Humitalea sp. 24SJ18S-53]|uniref:glycosyltransferase family 4 protein n=1 Tax=Humitalea sp. 24SJ18S-53 TaxID=3422307 RepID=UPI003D664173